MGTLLVLLIHCHWNKLVTKQSRKQHACDPARNQLFDQLLPDLGERGGGGLGDSGNARKKIFFSIDVFPKSFEGAKVVLQ